MRGRVVQLAQHKFASNVIEKCVTSSSRATRALMIDEVCSRNGSFWKQCDQWSKASERHFDQHVMVSGSFGRPLHHQNWTKDLVQSGHLWQKYSNWSTFHRMWIKVTFWLIFKVSINFSEKKPKISSDSLFTMMKDQYANYVVQKMLDIADMPQKKKMISQMKPQLSNLKRYTYGKHIITKLEKIIQSLQMNGNLN